MFSELEVKMISLLLHTGRVLRLKVETLCVYERKKERGRDRNNYQAVIMQNYMVTTRMVCPWCNF